MSPLARALSSRYGWSLAGLCLAALGQFWFMAVLLLGRQAETLLLCGVLACVFWFWCLWGYFLGKRRVGLILAGFCLAATLTISGMCLLDMLDVSDMGLLSRLAGAPRA